MKLSIVIPVYNVEKYIGRCIKSCLNQNVPSDSYEIIVINDGTPDKSAMIAREIAEQYSNVTVFDQDNQGLSVARNNGLRHAKGEYVWFVDSDDWIEENILSRIISKLTDNLDLLQLRYRYVYEDGTPSRDSHKNNISEIRSGEDVTLAGGLPTPAQFSIYRRDFLIENNLYFYPGIYHEDVEFKPRAIYNAKKILSHDEVVYNYLQRASGSITATYKLKNGLDSIIVCSRLYSFSKNLEENIKSCFAERIAQIVNTNMNRLSLLPTEEKEIILSEWKKNKYLFRYCLRSKSIISKIEGLIFYINAKVGASLFSFFFRFHS